MALNFGVMAAAMLLIDYFIQFTVVQINLETNQLDGWALLTQDNPNGVFTALEELGYLLMSWALVSLAPAFTGGRNIDTVLRRLLVAQFVAVIVSPVIVSALLGIDRRGTFEIAVITVV